MGSQGGVAMVGHKFALGNFEEGIRRVTSGLERVGTSRQVDGRFDHDTGMGYVAVTVAPSLRLSSCGGLRATQTRARPTRAGT